MKRLFCPLLLLAAAFTIYSCEETPEDTPTSVSVTSQVTLSDHAYSMEPGDGFDLTASIATSLAGKGVTADDLLWSNSNPDVADFVDGRMIAKAPGKTLITVLWPGDEAHQARCVVSVLAAPTIRRCEIPEGKNFLEEVGELYFMTDQTFIVGDQEWSDAVVATDANTWLPDDYPDGFDQIFWGGYLNPEVPMMEEGPFYPDCRANNDPIAEAEYGDLFSWCAVAMYRDEICPDGWRVPTTQDFIKLTIAAGGRNVVKDDYYSSPEVMKVLREDWGIRFGGISKWLIMDACDIEAVYWTMSEYSEDEAFLADFSVKNDRSMIQPSASFRKFDGLQVRCVRDIR